MIRWAAAGGRKTQQSVSLPVFPTRLSIFARRTAEGGCPHMGISASFDAAVVDSNVFLRGKRNGHSKSRRGGGGHDGQRDCAFVRAKWIQRRAVRCGAAVSGSGAADCDQESGSRGREEQDDRGGQGWRVEPHSAGYGSRRTF